MQKIKSLLDVGFRLLRAIYKILGSFSYKAMEMQGVRLHNEMSQQAVPAWNVTDKFYGLRSRNKHHLVPVCIVRPLSAMICISSRDPLNGGALHFQQLGRSCMLLLFFNPAVHWLIKCMRGTTPPSRQQRREVGPYGFMASLGDVTFVKHIEYQSLKKFC